LTARKFERIDGDFKYLIKMTMDSVTEENIAQIMEECKKAEQELANLQATTLEQMWLLELQLLEEQYDLYKQKREAIQSGTNGKKSTAAVKVKVKMVKS
jgi:isopropylmalate/homocitrate/citramalate synthase